SPTTRTSLGVRGWGEADSSKRLPCTPLRPGPGSPGPGRPSKKTRSPLIRTRTCTSSPLRAWESGAGRIPLVEHDQWGRPGAAGALGCPKAAEQPADLLGDGVDLAVAGCQAAYVHGVGPGG